MKEKLKALTELIAIIALFIFFSFIIQKNIHFFDQLINKSLTGILIYILIVIIAMVFAPITSIPLIPVMSAIWGWPLTAIISVIAWTTGAIAIFGITRKLGTKTLSKLIPMDQLYKIEKKMPEKNIIISTLFLRMIIPADILSYALGFFTKMKFAPYVIISFIGFIPGAFILAYIGKIHFIYQLIGALVFLILFLSVEIWRARITLKRQRFVS